MAIWTALEYVRLRRAGRMIRRAPIPFVASVAVAFLAAYFLAEWRHGPLTAKSELALERATWEKIQLENKLEAVRAEIEGLKAQLEGDRATAALANAAGKLLLSPEIIDPQHPTFRLENISDRPLYYQLENFSVIYKGRDSFIITFDHPVRELSPHEQRNITYPFPLDRGDDGDDLLISFFLSLRYGYAQDNIPNLLRTAIECHMSGKDERMLCHSHYHKDEILVSGVPNPVVGPSVEPVEPDEGD